MFLYVVIACATVILDSPRAGHGEHNPAPSHAPVTADKPTSHESGGVAQRAREM